MKFKGVVQNVLLESDNTKWNKESDTILLEKKKTTTLYEMGLRLYVHVDLFVYLDALCWYKKFSSVKALSANTSSFWECGGLSLFTLSFDSLLMTPSFGRGCYRSG